jgi:hypothetical protein
MKAHRRGYSVFSSSSMGSSRSARTRCPAPTHLTDFPLIFPIHTREKKLGKVCQLCRERMFHPTGGGRPDTPGAEGAQLSQTFPCIHAREKVRESSAPSAPVVSGEDVPPSGGPGSGHISWGSCTGRRRRSRGEIEATSTPCQEEIISPCQKPPRR